MYRNIVNNIHNNISSFKLNTKQNEQCEELSTVVLTSLNTTAYIVYDTFSGKIKLYNGTFKLEDLYYINYDCSLDYIAVSVYNKLRIPTYSTIKYKKITRYLDDDYYFQNSIVNSIPFSKTDIENIFKINNHVIKIINKEKNKYKFISKIKTYLFSVIGK